MAKILFFGKLADLAGGSEMDVTLPPQVRSLVQLREMLSDENEALGDALEQPNVRAAINKTIAPLRGDFPIRDSDEIAFMPPMSGG